jgi:dTDP-4-dehydrorhamnose 3,5-epimerase
MDNSMMQSNSLPIQGAFEILISPISDVRGSFVRLFDESEARVVGLTKRLVQVNHSMNKKKFTIRGMHFQKKPFSEIKIIYCLKGRVFDVMVDLRKGSTSFLHWHAIELAPEKSNMIIIPEGCAHGFQTLEDDTELLYFHSEAYRPEAEGAIKYDEQMVGVQWPSPPEIISEKDKSYPYLKPGFSGFEF